MIRYICVFTVLCCLMGAFTPVKGQSSLVSKGTGLMFEVDDALWVFDENNLSFSLVDIQSSPVMVNAIQRKQSYSLSGGMAFGRSIIGYYQGRHTDSTWRLGLLEVTQAGDNELYTADILQVYGQDFEDTLGGMTIYDSLLVMASGSGGVIFTELSRGAGGGINTIGSLSYQVLVAGDSLVQGPVCDSGATCSVEILKTISETIDFIVPVKEVALLPLAADSIILFMGSNGDTKGLRRGNISGGRYPPVVSQGLDTLNIRRIFAHPHKPVVWVFSDTRYFYSDDGGLNFRTPTGIPQNLIQSIGAVDLAFYGDSSWVNFDFPGRPGLVLFKGDSVYVNAGQDTADYGYFLSRGLSSLAWGLELSMVTTVQGNGRTFTAVGSSSRGLYYQEVGDTLWHNVSRQVGVKKDLQEVITFPTVYDGSRDVGLGYQLKKTADIYIEIYDYEMEKVRTVISGSRRKGGGSRSENPGEDKWDGRDDNGDYVSVGVYYVLVKSSRGERGWGKVIVIRGRDH